MRVVRMENGALLRRVRHQPVCLRQDNRLGIQSVQPCRLFCITVFDIAHELRFRHRTQDGAVGLGKFMHVRVRIIGGAVTQLQRIHILMLKQLYARSISLSISAIVNPSASTW